MKGGWMGLHMNPALGLQMERRAFTKTKASSYAMPWRLHMRYAMTSVQERETPIWQ